MQPQTTPQSRAGTAEMYTVVRGDTLSGIADDQQVRGGWRGLYAANRKAIGADPDLILPGQRLRCAAKAPRRRARGPSRREPAAAATQEAVPGRTKDAPRTAPRQASKERAGRPTTARGLVAPVSASLGTPYRKAGSSWSKGYHTGVDFPVPDRHVREGRSRPGRSSARAGAAPSATRW